MRPHRGHSISPALSGAVVRERVRKAAEKLSYAPDRMAKALSSGKSHTIGAVVPTLGNAIFADGVEALQERLGERGYILLLSNSQYDKGKELRQIRALLEHGVDGLVLVGNNFAPEVIPLIQQHRLRSSPLMFALPKMESQPSASIIFRRLTRWLAILWNSATGNSPSLPTPRCPTTVHRRGWKAWWLRLRKGMCISCATASWKPTSLPSSMGGAPLQACWRSIRGSRQSFAPPMRWRLGCWRRPIAQESKSAGHVHRRFRQCRDGGRS